MDKVQPNALEYETIPKMTTTLLALRSQADEGAGSEVRGLRLTRQALALAVILVWSYGIQKS